MLDFYDWLQSGATKSTSLADLLKMESASYNFSCPDCKHRWMENLVMGSLPKRGRCPRCNFAGVMPFRRF